MASVRWWRGIAGPRELLFMVCFALVAASQGCVTFMPLPPEVHGGRSIALRYEGTCAHLACCSAYAVPVPAQTPGAFRCEAQTRSNCSRNVGWFAPGFTCNPTEPGRYRQPDDPPYLDCNDYERWLSLPGLRVDQCGERFLVCHGGVAVTALVLDRSASNSSGNAHYEGSLGLLRALGADPGQRETFVSIYALDEREAIAADPQCGGKRN